MSATQLRAELELYHANGSAALMSVAGELARLALTPVGDALSDGRLAHVSAGDCNRLRIGAGALACALASTSPDLPGDHGNDVRRRAALAIPILQVHALLLREQRDPSHYSPAQLASTVAAPLREALDEIMRAQPSTAHTQRMIDRELGQMLAASRAFTAAMLAMGLLDAARALGDAAAAPLVDYNALCEEVVTQDGVRRDWLTPLPATPAAAPLGVADRVTSLRTLELSADAGLNDALAAFSVQTRALLAELPGSHVAGRDGPRLRWLALCAALTQIAWADEPSPSAPRPATAATVALDAEATPAHAGRYTLVEELGRGGMGIVYRAHDGELDRVVAVKLLTATAPWPAARDRFAREMRVMATLDHRSIVPVYDTGTQDGVPFIVMPLIAGPDLARVLSAGPLEPGRALRRIAELADALAHLHDRRLIHRDVKPHNVLLEHAETDRERALLVDFGIARGWDTQAGVTGPSQLLGTPGWIAPEVRAGRSPRPAVDQWALARLLVAMLLGSDAPAEGIVTSLSPLIGIGPAAAVATALNPEPERRHRDVTRFARALGRERSTLATLIHPHRRRRHAVG